MAQCKISVNLSSQSWRSAVFGRSPGGWLCLGKQLLQTVRVMKCQEPWWITLMIKCVFWVTAFKSGQGGTKCNTATTCPCRHGEVKATQALRVNTPDKTLPLWLNAKSPSEQSQTELFLPAQVTAGCRCQLQSRRLLHHAVPQTLKPSEAFLSPPPSSPVVLFIGLRVHLPSPLL